MSITKFNKGRVFDVKLEGLTTVKLSTLKEGEKYCISAIMFTEKGKYGKSAFVVLPESEEVVYLPKHMLKACEEIVIDAECVADIKAGKVGIIPETYEDETGATRYSVKWCDM